VRQVFRRAAILYALGLFIYLFPDFHWGTMRVLGVLQRIAICYLIASVIYLFTGWRGQIAWIIGLLASYWILMTLVPVPGYGPGNLSVQGNLAHYVDHLVLGQHNYAQTRTWDPEGIVSTVPAIVTALLGLLAGQLLKQKWSLKDKVLWLSVMGICLIAAGLIVSTWLPINKKLWTDSFSLFMAGLDSIVLSVFIWCVDGLGWKRVVKPFVIFGMNAITIYVISEVLAIILDRIEAGGISVHSWIYQHGFAPFASPKFASFCDAFCYVLLMFVLAYALYRKRVFIRI
jgi:predicted acyltransferase